MLTASKLKALQDLAAAFSKEELIWVNGYLAGLLSGNSAPVETPVTPAGARRITIAYGTESGNSKKVAVNFAAIAKQKGIQAKIVSLDQYRVNDLAKEEYFFTIISTQGEGEPPAAAKKFYDHIHQNGFKVNKLKYGVLALGDTSYPLFCKAGEDVDAQLQQLGGERIVSLVKCDTDFEPDATVWFNEALSKLTHKENGHSQVAVPLVKPARSGKKIYQGTVVKNINLNDRGSKKETHHLEITCEELDYLPGDSIGLVPFNPPALVQAILSMTGADPDGSIEFRNNQYTIRDLLERKLNIVYLPERVVRQYAAIVKQDIPATRIGLADLMRIYPVKDVIEFEEVLRICEPVTPRLYSISSSRQAHGDEVHLTVARDHFYINEEQQCGLCSGYLCSLEEGATVDFYIHRNDQFRLPDAGSDVIMIGPGTGIAPFRAFLAEREATGAEGRNWLFFGDQHFVTDFLYQSEIQNWKDTGLLTRVNVAFSRDQQEKVYVQHKMEKHGEEFFNWLKAGAGIYVCGAKSPMSEDVEKTILDIISRYGNQSRDNAEAFLNELKESGRYHKDVY